MSIMGAPDPPLAGYGAAGGVEPPSEAPPPAGPVGPGSPLPAAGPPPEPLGPPEPVPDPVSVGGVVVPTVVVPADGSDGSAGASAGGVLVVVGGL
jgi:hypothetical protein